jgi:hypothetical protein
MQWHGLRIHIVLLALLVGLVVFFGARWLYNKFSFEEPLAAALKKSKAVASFEIEHNQPVKILVNLNPTENLKETYQELYQQAQSVLGDRKFLLKLADNRNEKLKHVFYYSQFAVYEAIKLGNYMDMIKFIEEESRKVGATSSVFLDQDNIYIQLHLDNYYLYEIIPRTEVAPLQKPLQQ